MNKILLIGCGHMGSALLNSWVAKTKNSFLVVDPLKYKGLNKKFTKKIKFYKSIETIKDLNKVQIVIFAIKPQIVKNALKDFKNLNFNKKVIYVSIVAGKKINFYNQFIPNPNQFIRAMPNMPALINEGMSCLVANKNVTKKNKKKIDDLFLKVGKTLWLKNELDINKVTAISGSGPGYIFLFIDAFIKASKLLDLNDESTKKLIYQTFLGTIHLLINQKKDASVLAKEIAVQGGTTEAGLSKFMKNKMLHKVFEEVIKASFNKANELGKK